MTASEFAEQDVTIKLRDGSENVRGYVSPDYPLLAITPMTVAQFEFWQVTHLPTGLALNITAWSRDTLEPYIPRIWDICDWSDVDTKNKTIPAKCQQIQRLIDVEEEDEE